MAAEERIRSNDEPSPEHVIAWLALPAQVLSAFSCELFLKTLLILEGQQPSDTHSLSGLYKRLGNKRKDRLSAMWDKAQVDKAYFYDAVEKVTGERPARDLRGALKTCGDAFISIRYHYEDGSKSRFYISDLPRILHDYILELKPEWE